MSGPRAGFSLGNRYELGYRDQGHGWTIGVLDGGTLNQTNTYGFIPRASDGGVPPFIPADYTDGTDVGVPTGTVGTTGPVGDARAFGFGSVPVLFETPSTATSKASAITCRISHRPSPARSAARICTSAATASPSSPKATRSQITSYSAVQTT